MSKFLAIAAGSLRFAAALLIGVPLLIVLQFAIIFGGGPGHMLSGVLFPLGLVLVVFLAGRFAVHGNRTRLDRTTSSLAAGASAAVLTGVSVVAGTVLAVLLIVFGLFAMAGGGSAAAAFGPTLLTAGAIFLVANLGARALLYACLRTWLSPTASRWLSLSSFFALFVAILIFVRLA
jgi:hypothetical protein